MMTFNDLITLSVNADEQTEWDIDFGIKVTDQLWHAYTAIVSNRDILLLCDKGSATFLVDSHGDKHSAVLHDWCTDD
jgi:hypothetical protein